MKLKLRKAFKKIRATHNPADAWLIHNKLERMDANRTDIFKPSRADFHKDRYQFACSYVHGEKVLDIACGTGYGSHLLKNEGSATIIYGMDIEYGAIDYANRTYSSPHLNFLEGSITDIPFRDNLFDVVVSFETIEHVENETAQLTEISRVLKPGGLYILSTPNDWGADDKSPHHVRSYTLESLRDSVEKYFDIQNVYNQNSGTPGRKQNHDQPRGIVESSDKNWKTAECYIAVAKAGTGTQS